MCDGCGEMMAVWSTPWGLLCSGCDADNDDKADDSDGDRDDCKHGGQWT